MLCFLGKQKKESREKCNGLDTPSLERIKDRQEFESEVALGARPHGKQ